MALKNSQNRNRSRCYHWKTCINQKLDMLGDEFKIDSMTLYNRYLVQFKQINELNEK